MNFIKTNLLSLVVIGLAVALYFQRCNANTETAVAKRDTTYSVQYVQQPPVTVPQYQPIIIESKQPATVPQQYQAAADPSVLLKQYQDVVNKLIAINYSRDSLQLKDSSGNNVGTVKINDVVTENQIKSRDLSYILRIPKITETITINQPYKPRGQLYIGGGINGSKTDFVNAFEAGLMWKNKKDQLFGLKAGLGTSGQINYGIQSYWKIKLHK